MKILTILFSLMLITSLYGKLKLQDSQVAPIKVVMPIVDKKYDNTTIVVKFIVSYTGKVEDIVILTEIDKDTREKVKESLLKWEFQPQLENGKTVKSSITIPIPINF